MVLAFSGNFKFSVDSKGRVNIPAPFRNQLSDMSDNTFHVAYGPNECLFVYPRERFVEIASNMEESYGSLAAPEDQRRYLLQMMHDAHPSRCDQQGRIIVPKKHLEYAKIEKDVLIVGVVTKLEFWNPAIFDEFMNNGSMSNKELVRRFGGADRK